MADSKQNGNQLEPQEKIDAVRREYIQGVDVHGQRVFPTLASLARKHDIAFKTLKDYSWKQAWSEERKQFRAQLDSTIRREVLDRIGSAAASFQVRCFDLAEQIIDAAEAGMMEEVAGTHKGEDNQGISAMQLRHYAAAAAIGAKMGSNALGLTEDNNPFKNLSENRDSDDSILKRVQDMDPELIKRIQTQVTYEEYAQQGHVDGEQAGTVDVSGDNTQEERADDGE